MSVHEKRNEGLVLLTMDHGPANALDQHLVDELTGWFRAAREDDAVAGAVLAGKPRFFSAGLDLIRLYGYDREAMAHFWRSFLDLLRTMAAWDKPLVAAITGHAPAGGCLLALTADHRVMAEGKYTIGLNEVPVGIAVPEPIFELYRFWLGTPRAYALLLDGTLLPSAEAAAIGLVDAVVPEDAVVAAAEERLRGWLAHDRLVWRRSKAALRRRLLDDMAFDFDAVFGPALDHWFSAPQRARMGALVERLTKK